MDNKIKMELALQVATGSNAERGKIGVVAYRDGRLVGVGVNKLPDNLPRTKCETDAPTVEESHTLPEVLHAEESLICNAAFLGESLLGSEVYITRTPCKHCAAHLAQTGINKLYYFSEHPHGDGLPILEEAGIPTEKVNFEQNILEDKYL